VEESMTVRELIAILSQKDPDANVLVMMQPSYPFECAFAGVAVRGDFQGVGDVYEHGRDDADPWPGGERANDVFLLEGSQIRYGSKQAWEAAQTDA
jgi:hypothetical protein